MCDRQQYGKDKGEDFSFHDSLDDEECLHRTQDADEDDLRNLVPVVVSRGRIKDGKWGHCNSNSHSFNEHWNPSKRAVLLTTPGFISKDATCLCELEFRYPATHHRPDIGQNLLEEGDIC